MQTSDIKGQKETIRISFNLDASRYGALAQHLLPMTGHGDRPRELMRLAMLGMQAEREMVLMAKVARQAGFYVNDQPEGLSDVRVADPSSVGAAIAPLVARPVPSAPTGLASAEPVKPALDSVTPERPATHSDQDRGVMPEPGSEPEPVAGLASSGSSEQQPLEAPDSGGQSSAKPKRLKGFLA